MKKFFLKLETFQTAKFLIREKRLIFLESSESIGDALEKALTTLANSAARLLDLSGDVLEFGIDALGVGKAHLKDIYEWGKEKIQDPGQPDPGLPEYADRARHFNEPDKITTVNWIGSAPKNYPNLDIAMQYHANIAFLTLRITQRNEFMKPAMQYFQLVESMKNRISNNRKALRPRIKELRDEISKLESTIDSGNLSETDPRRIRFEKLLAAYRSQLLQLESACSYEVNLPTPELTETKFPPKYGYFTDRLIINSNKTSTIDLNGMHNYLKYFTTQYESELNTYKEEIEKLKYHRDRLINKSIENIQNESQRLKDEAASLKKANRDDEAKAKLDEADTLDDRKRQLETNIQDVMDKINQNEAEEVGKISYENISATQTTPDVVNTRGNPKPIIISSVDDTDPYIIRKDPAVGDPAKPDVSDQY